MSGELQAAYMLAPLVMDLADKKVPVKIVSIGHRSGAVIMVRQDSAYRNFRSLAGKRVAIPSRFAVDFLFLRKMLAMEGMTPDDVEVVEMAPADMPAALYVSGVDAYCTGEPFGAAAQSAGYARPLSMTRDEWPRYMCCVLTVREELIRSDRPLVQNLVNYVLGAGAWLDTQPQNRTKAVGIAAGPRLLQPGSEDPRVRHDQPGRPRDLRRLAHDPARVRRAHAAVGRGRHAHAPGALRDLCRRQLREGGQTRVDPAVMLRPSAGVTGVFAAVLFVILAAGGSIAVLRARCRPPQS
jgi:NitT/TauT family transport system substrate-binding protein